MKKKKPLLPRDDDAQGGDPPTPGNNKGNGEAHMPWHHWYSQDEMLAKLGMCANTLKKHRQKGHIGYSQVGAKFFYREDDYQRFLMLFYKGPFLLLWAVSWLADSMELVSIF